MSLETIFAESKKINVGGKEYEIKQISLGNLPKVLTVFANVFDKDDKRSTQEKIVGLVQNDFDNVKEVLVLLTNLNKEEVEKLSIAGGIYFVSEIIKENSSFLASKVIPMVQGMTQSLDGLDKSKS